MKAPIESLYYKEIYEDIRAKLLLPELRSRLKADGADPDVAAHSLNILYAAYRHERFYTDEKCAKADRAYVEIASRTHELKVLTGRLMAKAGESHSWHPHLKEIHELVQEMVQYLPSDDQN